MDLPFQAAGLRKVEMSFGRFMQVVFKKHRLLGGAIYTKPIWAFLEMVSSPSVRKAPYFEKDLATWLLARSSRAC